MDGDEKDDSSNEDCNLSDNEEEKNQFSMKSQKKAFLSVEKILHQIKKEAKPADSAMDTKLYNQETDEYG